MISVWVIALSLLVTAFFSAAEMAFIAANRVRLRHLAEDGTRTAARYLEAFQQPERLLSTAMMGVTIAHISASAVATWALLPRGGRRGGTRRHGHPHAAHAGLRRDHPQGGGARVGHRPDPAAVPPARAGGHAPRAAAWGANDRGRRRSWRSSGRRRTSTRQFVSRDELKLLLQMEPDGGRRDHVRGRDDRQDLRPRRDDGARGHGAAGRRGGAARDGDARRRRRLIRERGFSRLPVYPERDRTSSGVVTAMDLLRRGARGGRRARR